MSAADGLLIVCVVSIVVLLLAQHVSGWMRGDGDE